MASVNGFLQSGLIADIEAVMAIVQHALFVILFLRLMHHAFSSDLHCLCLSSRTEQPPLHNLAC